MLLPAFAPGLTRLTARDSDPLLTVGLEGDSLADLMALQQLLEKKRELEQLLAKKEEVCVSKGYDGTGSVPAVTSQGTSTLLSHLGH